MDRAVLKMNGMEKFAMKYKELRKRYKKVMANREKWITYSREARKKLKGTRKRVAALEKLLKEKNETVFFCFFSFHR